MVEEPRIEIQKNGPYRILGDLPLLEMAPVHTFNGEPVAWHTLRGLPPVALGNELCRCGKSRQLPLCDRSHAKARFEGDSSASRAPYEERARKQVSSNETLADDTALCIEAGFCGTRTTNVWKLFVECRDFEGRESMRAMVWRCPSGRIALFRGPDGSPVEPSLPKEIAILPGGPLWVRGGVPVVDSDGFVWEPRNRVTLCRCGESRNKPFCDGTHAVIHFDER
jgi:CDGSH-type Zn-finger protein